MSKKTTLTSGKSLMAFLDAAIQESTKSARAQMYQRALQEKEKQQASQKSPEASSQGGGSDQGSGGVDLFSDDGGGDEGGDEETQSKTGEDEQDKLKSGEVSVKDVVEKLNSIRSGRSFKDSAVSGAMEEYVDSLSKAEKTALLAFLKGIAQIVTGEVPGDQAVEPDTKPANVEMNKKNSTQHVNIKPNVIKTTKQGKPASDEDTTPPAPITPKK